MLEKSYSGTVANAQMAEQSVHMAWGCTSAGRTPLFGGRVQRYAELGAVSIRGSL